MGIETILLAVGAATGLFAAGTGYKSSVQAAKARDEEKKKVKAREAELAAESAARTAATEKAKTAGQRAGFGGGVPSFRNNLIGGTGFGAAGSGGGGAMREDNIGRGSLFGN